MISEPFQIGEFISVSGMEGRVEDIEARATIITSKDGRKVVIPNATLFTNPVAVQHNGGPQNGAEKQGGPAPQNNPPLDQSRPHNENTDQNEESPQKPALSSRRVRPFFSW